MLGQQGKLFGFPALSTGIVDQITEIAIKLLETPYRLSPLACWPLQYSISSKQREMIFWFGICGIGSIYYLMLALDGSGARHRRSFRRCHRVDADDSRRLHGRAWHFSNPVDAVLCAVTPTAAQSE